MKKVIALLVAVYIGLVAFQVYQKNEVNKKWSDERWRFFERVIIGNNLNELYSEQVLRWRNDIKIRVEGNPTSEDMKALENVMVQMNELIAPEKISLSQNNSNLSIYFQGKSNADNRDYWPRYAMARYSLKTFLDRGYFDRSEITRYVSERADFFIRTDLSNQTQRNELITKGLSYILLGIRNVSLFSSEKSDSAVFFDNLGHHLNFPNFDPHFKNSIFNSYCNHCTQLSDVDRFIIKSYYSPSLDDMIAKNSRQSFFQNASMFFNLSLALIVAIIVLLYFSNFFDRYFFSFIDKHIRVSWVSFNFKVLIIFVFYSILYLSISMGHLYITRSGLKTDFPEPVTIFPLSLIKSLIFWMAYVLIPVNFIYLIEKVCFPKFEQFAKQQLFSFILLVTGFLWATWLLNRWYFNFPMPKYSYSLPLYFGVGIGLARFLFNFSNYQRRLAVMGKDQELTRLRELKTRAELNALQSKINPHFLYNALNSIAGLAHKNADTVEQMALALSKLFRYSINKEENDFTTVRNEVEMAEIYLDIEKVRFGDRLDYSLSIEKNVEEESIPKFIIQPLVENAIKHGISNVRTQGILKLEITKNNNELYITVYDNGPDFPDDIVTGYGLQAIYEKLDILYPDRYEIQMQNGKDKNIQVVLK
jgi:two-component system, LytTR family, sensor kinase